MNLLYVTTDRISVDELTADRPEQAPEIHLECIGSLGDAKTRLERPDGIDCVIVDQRLPDGDGLSLIPSLRQRDPHLAVVAALRTDGRVSPLTALRAGADDYLTKDESFAARLLPTVEVTIRRRSQSARSRTSARVLYAGEIDFARQHLTDPTVTLEIVAAAHGADGRLRLEPDQVSPSGSGAVDLIMLEFGFPGVQVFELLKEALARNLRTPIVVVIKPQEEDLARPALKLGASEWVVKSEASFQASVGRLLNLADHHAGSNAEGAATTPAKSEDAGAPQQSDATDTKRRSRAEAERRFHQQLEAEQARRTEVERSLTAAQAQVETLTRELATRSKGGDASSVREDEYRRLTIQRDELERLAHESESRFQELAAARQVDRDTLHRSLEEQAGRLRAAESSLLEVEARARVLAEAEARAQTIAAERQATIEQLERRISEQDDAVADLVRQETSKHAALEAALAKTTSDMQSLSYEHSSVSRKSAEKFRDEELRLTQLLSEEAAKRAALEVALVEARSALDMANRELLSAASLIEGPLGVVRCTADGNILEANRALAILLGWASRSELTGASMAKDLLVDEAEFPLMVDACRQGTLTGWEMSWKQKDGSSITVRLSATLDSGDTLALTVEDVTDTELLERQLRQSRRMEAVGRRAAEAARTFHSLFGTVSEHLDKVAASLEPQPELLAECTRAQQATVRARNAAEQLLTFSQRQLATIDAIDPNQLLGQVEPVLRRVAGEQIEIGISLGSPLGWVDIESEHLERIFLSLAMSSREVMPLGGKLQVETANLFVDRKYASRRFGLRTGPHVLVSMVVTGCGVESIGQNDTLDKTGFGLETVRTLVRQTGGQFWVEMPQSGEVRFSVCLPQSQIDRRRRGRETLVWTEPGISS